MSTKPECPPIRKCLFVKRDSIHHIQTCYRYSWAGVYDPEEDDGKLCDDFFPDDICFPPLVFTDGATGTGLPDIE